MNSLEVRIKAPEKKIDSCIKAIELETQVDQQRSKVKLTKEGDSLLLRIEAEDLTALRAALNTYLRWVDMCLQLTEKG